VQSHSILRQTLYITRRAVQARLLYESERGLALGARILTSEARSGASGCWAAFPSAQPPLTFQALWICGERSRTETSYKTKTTLTLKTRPQVSKAKDF